jgi:DNA-binding transcriptional ArsR family regulator
MSTPKNQSIDPLIHEPARLKLMAALYECDEADFNFLLAATGLTRGNFSAHMAKLVIAGYVVERKSFVNRLPHTSYQLSDCGRDSYGAYLLAWKRITNGHAKRATTRPTIAPVMDDEQSR